MIVTIPASGRSYVIEWSKDAPDAYKLVRTAAADESEGETFSIASSDPKARPALLRIKRELLAKDRSEMRAALMDETANALSRPPAPDEIIIRVSGVQEDLQKSLVRVGTRLAKLLELSAPERVRSIGDPAAIASKYAQDPEGFGKDILAAPFDTETKTLALEIAETVRSLEAQIERCEARIEQLLTENYRNFTRIATPKIAARLIRQAGGFEEIVRMPAGTIQLLGAETALFRHLRNRKQLPPKYGVLHEHPIISQAGKQHHGKLARLIADKLALAAKLDYFKSEDTDYIEKAWHAIETTAKRLAK